MSRVRRRADFPARVKHILAGRAGYRCSFPDCGKPTIGPGASNSEISTSGVASHIYSAAETGPRGVGGLSLKERSDPENGIWLCAEHARLIDANRGDRYTPGTLRRYKYLHESRVDMEHGHRPLAWLEELVINRSDVFIDGATLKLGKVMLIEGENGSGKTLIFRLLNSLSSEMRFNLDSLANPNEELSYSLRLRNPEPQELRVDCAGGQTTVLLNDRVAPFVPFTVETFFQERRTNFRSLESFLSRKRRIYNGDFEELDDLALLSEYWQISPDIVRKLVSRAGTIVDHAFSDARFVEIGGVNRLLVNDKRWKPDAPIHKISGGMLEMLSLDVSIAQAIFLAEHFPTVLLLHAALLHLSPNNLKRYADFLTSQAVKFQTLIETPSPSWVDVDFPWEVVRLKRDRGKTFVSQTN